MGVSEGKACSAAAVLGGVEEGAAENTNKFRSWPTVVEINLPCGLIGGPVGVKGSSFGKKDEFMSPIPTKKSSIDQGDYLGMRRMTLNAQGMTLIRFGLHSQTSARSSMITTIDVSQGNRRCRLF